MSQNFCTSAFPKEKLKFKFRPPEKINISLKSTWSQSLKEPSMVALLRASFMENCVLLSDTCGGLKNCSQRSKADRPNGIKSNITT